MLLGGHFTSLLATGTGVAADVIKERVAAAYRAVAKHDHASVAAFNTILHFHAECVEPFLIIPVTSYRMMRLTATTCE